MANNEIPNGDEKLIGVFAELLSLDLYPDTVDEAVKIINEAGIDLGEFERMTTSILRGIHSEHEDDWRNTPVDVMDVEVAKLESFKLKSNLLKDELIEKITQIVDMISTTGQIKYLPLGIAHRNFQNQTEDDLAQLLRQLEYAASELGVDFEDE